MTLLVVAAATTRAGVSTAGLGELNCELVDEVDLHADEVADLIITQAPRA